MTKKDYVAMARTLCATRETELRTEAEFATHDKLCDRIADVCAADNPRFDRERFLSACGIPGHDAPRRTRGGAR